MSLVSLLQIVITEWDDYINDRKIKQLVFKYFQHFQWKCRSLFTDRPVSRLFWRRSFRLEEMFTKLFILQ